jgi:hypothetical protein
MSRRFAADNSEVRWSLPAAVDATGAFTVAAVVRRRGGLGVQQHIIGSVTSAGTVSGWDFGFEVSGSNTDRLHYGSNNSASFIVSSTAVSDTTNWWLVAISKPTGSSQPRAHFRNLTTSAAAVHENTLFGTVSSPLTASGGTIRVGENKDIADLDANLAVVAYWGLNLTDAQIDELWAHNKTDDFLLNSAGVPLVCYEFNQATATDPVPDLSVNGAAWSLTNGTAVDGSENPPSWIYHTSLGPPATVDPTPPLSILQMPFMVGFPNLPLIFAPQPVSPRPTVFDQTVDLDSIGIASAEAFGSHSVITTQFIDADTRGIASAEAFGVDRVDSQVLGTGIASLEAFGTARVDLTINTVGIASAEAFGGLREDLSISPTGIASVETFGVASVSASTGTNVNLTGITSTEAFGTTRVDLSNAPTGIASAEAFGSATVNVTVAGSISPTGITSTESFGTTRVDVSSAPTGIPSAEAFGIPRIDLGLLLTGITSAESFGSDRVDLQITPTGIPSLLAFGSDRVDLSILLTGIPSSEAFGSTDRIDESILMTAIPSGEAFGPIIVTGGALVAGSRGDLATMGYGT